MNRVSTRRLLSLLLAGGAIIMGTVTLSDGGALDAMMLQRRGAVPWKIITADQVRAGVLVPQDTNIIFTVPSGSGSIAREDLFGHRGNSVRYWGYCFPQDTDPAPTHGLFPGKLFLSEAERAARVKAQTQTPTYSILNPPTQQELDKNSQPTVNGAIRHQVEMFQSGQTCYLMTAGQLEMGYDDDGDGLNNAEEKRFGTDPEKADTDGDGIPDGMEVNTFHTNPLNPDTDHDGLSDGEETHGHSHLVPSHLTSSGAYVQGDTDPTNPDTDHDGLCDGYCQMDVTGSFCGNTTGTGSYYSGATIFKCVTTNRWAGENAKTLSGGKDTWESDPTKWSTRNDGLSDFDYYYKQVLLGQTPTP